jgi:hypothetical protein
MNNLLIAKHWRGLIFALAAQNDLKVISCIATIDMQNHPIGSDWDVDLNTFVAVFENNLKEQFAFRTEWAAK